jgi:hypothetical protein
VAQVGLHSGIMGRKRNPQIYIVQIGQRQHGPLTMDQLLHKLSKDQFGLDDWVWDAKLNDWVRIRTLFTPPKVKEDGATNAIQVCSVIGAFMIGVCMWGSCSAKDGWINGVLGDSAGRDFEAWMTLPIIVGFMMTIPAILLGSSRKSAGLSKQLAELEEFNKKVLANPNQCPSCGSALFQTYYPSKPVVFTPLTFSGALLGGIANSLADSMIKPYRVCERCRCRWNLPQ